MNDVLAQVSFGEWDLNDDSGQILETKLVAVNDHKSTSLMHDVALLQLEGKVDVDSYPHFGMGCLPYPRVFYYASHAWDCFTVGWPATKQGVPVMMSTCNHTLAVLTTTTTCNHYFKQSIYEFEALTTTLTTCNHSSLLQTFHLLVSVASSHSTGNHVHLQPLFRGPNNNINGLQPLFTTQNTPPDSQCYLFPQHTHKYTQETDGVASSSST
ncbi:hypothetical protein E2C01_037618 [Portunus trituberculatus]|uniref:Uncharacterized protein n=1 Tax=Portunus trituberculatus TaxID=210409 RepID=A0A5B7FFF0_PORTR|nr:hypothetical protein [Portunus trituberculatus]